MKKKFREITVNDIKYGWVINNNCDGDGGNCLRIYKNRSVVYDKLVACEIEEITPKLVSEIIKGIK